MSKRKPYLHLFYFYSAFIVVVLLVPLLLTPCFIPVPFAKEGRFLKQGIHSRDYMIITGLGFILFLFANGATLIQTAYPPYGIATVSAMSLASFMILTGLYYSAVSVAQDITLRNSMRQAATNDMKFLEGIGMAQVEKEVQTRVSKLEKVFKEQITELEKLSGVQSSIQEQDIK